MAISYNRLWKLLVDKKMSKADLRKAAGLAPNTMTKLRRDEPVAMGVLEKICGTLDTDFGGYCGVYKRIRKSEYRWFYWTEKCNKNDKLMEESSWINTLKRLMR